MFTKTIVAALAAAGPYLVSAQTSSACSAEKFTVNSQADFSAFMNCQTLTGNLELSGMVDTILDLSGPSTITGDISLTNNMAVQTIKSSTLQSIGGTFNIRNTTALTTISLPVLSSVNIIFFQSLGNLNSITLGTSGLSKANSITISDTFVDTLVGLDVAVLQLLNLNNNRRLATFTSKIRTMTNLTLAANSQLSASFPNLTSCAEIQVSNVTGLSIPLLQAVNGSFRFDSNTFQTLAAPNLTMTMSDISFRNNNGLTNISLPALTQIGGGLTIANNSVLAKIDGFPVLKQVGGAVLIRGNLESIAFPALNDVKGAFDVASTKDISSSCAVFDKMKPTKQGGTGQIQGSESCQSNVQGAGTDQGTGGSSGGSGGGGNKNGNGVSLNINLSVLIGLLIVGAIHSLL